VPSKLTCYATYTRGIVKSLPSMTTASLIPIQREEHALYND
jgi:hypothetical protein